MQKYIARISLFVTALLFMSACASVEMTGTYTNPELIEKAPYHKILVNSMFADLEAKQLMETQLRDELAENGLVVSLGHALFPGSEKGFKESKVEVFDKIQQSGHDGILNISVIAKESNTRFIAADGTYSPVVSYPYYATYWGYYDYIGPIVYKPGYYTQTRTYFIEANFYDVATEKLVWSAQTETYSPADIGNLTENLADLIEDELEEEGLLPPEEEEM